MDPHQYNGGNWMMMPTQSSMNQDFHLLQSQFHQPQQQQQQPPQQQLQQPQTAPAPAPQQPQQPQHSSLVSHFNLLPLVEKLAEAIDSGNRDQQYEALVSELTNQFKRCQHLLDSISETISAKSMTVEGQKSKLEETMEQLNQRRDLITKYRSRVEELVKPENNK